MATATVPPALTAEGLLTRGYFPDRVIPPVNSIGLSVAVPDILIYVRPILARALQNRKPLNIPRSRSVTHSVPKRKHLRRILSVPNPLHQSILADEIASNWPQLKVFFCKSPVSLSLPRIGTERAIEATNDLNKQPLYRAQKSIGARYLLKTDIARFYPSIYTHSIPWALHGKSTARADKKHSLIGNRIDLLVRETQDKQTGGIPIGPDTSFLIGEIIGTALDLELQKRLQALSGTRSIDDYFLYFGTVAEAEAGLAALHEVALEFELEINDPKTEIVPLPEALEPAWKSDLRTLGIRDSGQPQATDLLTLFDRAFVHARNFPADSVLTYAAKQALSASITEENWKLCEAMLLRAAIGEPSMLSVLIDMYDKYLHFHTDNSALTCALESICAYHAPLQQGNEVAWALWLAKKRGITISKAVGDKIVKLDDDIVALVALDLHNSGLLDVSGFPKWRSYMTGTNLYSNHWLLAYEAHEQHWLPSRSGADYIASDGFFSILRTHGVRFYGAAYAATASYFSYSDDEDTADQVEHGVLGAGGPPQPMLPEKADKT